MVENRNHSSNIRVLGHDNNLEGFTDKWSCEFGHQTIMGLECIEALNVKSNGIYVDATLGGGGHSRLILEKLDSDGRLICLDKDPYPINWAQNGWAKDDCRVLFSQNSFGNLEEVLSSFSIDKVDGILADLGLSSWQLAESGRGFSLNLQEKLDMRMNPDTNLTAWTIINTYDEKELADIFWKYGDIRKSRRVARGIVWAREKQPIEDTAQLASIIARSLYRPGPPPRIHPATTAFMALRIAVNDELADLDNLLLASEKRLKTGGRLAVISFHSLEDRPVKFFLKQTINGSKIWKTLFKKPQIPSEQELSLNPRARSAKLRAAEKIL